jgi:DNA repair exonuclease SbcCD ATPase subunit
MKLLRLKVEGFGALKGDIVFDPRRATLLVDENERGKSTLLAAIAAALYGLENNRTVHRVLTPLERWRPWDNSPYRLELEVESEGERYTIRRDFDRGIVAVTDARGKEVTQDFREGKGEYPVGRKLTGLDADEFARCALVLQHELDEVVSSDPAVRRDATLHSRLENAADTRGGDTNATEAVAVLEEAARKYTAAELDTTLTVDNAIQRLELLEQTLEADLKALEHDHAGIAAPLEGLLRITDEEQAARDRMRKLDYERRDSLADDVRRQLAENAKHKADLDRYKAEAESLASSAAVSSGAETEFRETVTRLEEAQRHLAKLEEKRQEELSREREKRQKELGTLGPFASAAPQDADRCITLAAELKRVAEEDSSVRTAVFTLRDSLASQGHDPARIQHLTQRFGELTDPQQRLLRSQAEHALAYQTEVASLERTRTDSNQDLREIDAQRSRSRGPAWVLTGLGIAGAVAGGLMWRTGGASSVWIPLLAAGGVMLLMGLAMFGSGRGARAADRTEALRRLTEAQRRLNQMRDDRATSGVGVRRVET